MTTPNQSLEKTFLELAAIDEVHPHENKVLSYIERRLKQADATYHRDQAGNIIARLNGADSGAIALVGHVDVAASLDGRKVLVVDKTIKTDGTGLLGADDKAAVAIMLELADYVHTTGEALPRSVELVFTVGEEAGCVGAKALDVSLIRAKQALVLDWLGV